MAQHAPLVAVDRAPLGTICIDHHSRYVMLVKGREQGYPKRRLGAHQAIAATAQRTLPVVDLEQRQRARRSSAPDIGHRRRRLLL